jgi:hypothetical protein|tara:strand:- start:17 stop:625 length:609 start_codon:yes stop_codon:yes gene_type:complete
MSTDFKTIAIEKALTSFGSKLIEKARSNLNKEDKAGGTLYSQMSYDIEKTETGLKFKMDFGKAENYWAFVDQGVRGKGGYKGRGNLRGVGSPFKFGTRNFQGGLKEAIRDWVFKKKIRGRVRSDWKGSTGKAGRFITKESLVFLITRAIYTRGLKRSRFITKPFNDMIEDLKKTMQLAVKDDVGTSQDEYLKTQDLKIKISL